MSKYCIFKKDLKKDVADIKTLIKAHEVVKNEYNSLEIELSASIYRRVLKLFEEGSTYLFERNADIEKVICLEERKKFIEDKALLNYCTEGLEFIISYLNL